MLTGKSIMITGGTGAFGRKFVEKILSKFPEVERLVVFSRDELKQFEMSKLFPDTKYSQLRYFIGDVRDKERLRRAFEGIDIVIHAAALKQIPVCEYNPFEAIQTNIIGAQNVIDAAMDNNVRQVIAISSDKAAAPINLHGATKLCADKLFVAANNFKGKRDIKLSVVRLGNFLESFDSDVNFFLGMSASDEMPIADRRMTRFLTTLDNCFEMVLSALANMWGGEIFVPKIPSYHIVELAEAVSPGSKKQEVGLLLGEKLHEELITKSDAMNAVMFKDYFVILPSMKLWDVDNFISTFDGAICPNGFSYESASNSDWLTIEQLREIIVKKIDPTFRVNGIHSNIPYGRQTISSQDIQAVNDVLQSDWLTQGPAIENFEVAVAGYCGAKYAVVVNSATSALHIACLAADLGPGDILWTTPNTFVASANCGVYCGAAVDFVDIDPTTYNMCVRQLEMKLISARQQGRLPKVIVPVHFSGQSCQMDRIAELAKEYGFVVIEDASHAIGAKFRGQAVGSCAYSDMAVFSFHPVKIITAGEGGMVMTNNEDLYNRLLRLRAHGITRNPNEMKGTPHGPWYYEQIELGFNYRITDIQAALGISQLSQIDHFITRRNVLAKRYDDALQGLPLVLPKVNPDAYSAYHLYVVRLKGDGDVMAKRKQVFEQLRNDRIGVNIHYIPVHTQPYYKEKFGFKEGDFPVAEQYYREVISIPIYNGLTDDQQDYVIDRLRQVVR